jgi:hypothetical protein
VTAKRRRPRKRSRRPAGAGGPAAPKRESAKAGPATARKKKPQPIRWNPEPEDVQRSVVKLVLSLIEFIRKLMERQAVRRMEEHTLTPEEIEKVGQALMRLEKTVAQIAKRFNLDPKELNLDLGPIGRLH